MSFKDFPDSYEEMVDQGLAYCEYTLVKPVPSTPMTLKQLIAQGIVKLSPVTYEDFLPASAAGIFQSNLDEHDRSRSASPPTDEASKEVFAAILPVPLRDSFALHEQVQTKSLRQLEAQLGYAL